MIREAAATTATGPSPKCQPSISTWWSRHRWLNGSLSTGIISFNFLQSKVCPREINMLEVHCMQSIVICMQWHSLLSLIYAHAALIGISTDAVDTLRFSEETKATCVSHLYVPRTVDCSAVQKGIWALFWWWMNNYKDSQWNFQASHLCLLYILLPPSQQATTAGTIRCFFEAFHSLWGAIRKICCA